MKIYLIKIINEWNRLVRNVCIGSSILQGHSKYTLIHKQFHQYEKYDYNIDVFTFKWHILYNTIFYIAKNILLYIIATTIDKLSLYFAYYNFYNAK